MGFFRREYWSGLPFPSPGDLPDPGIKPRSPALQAVSLPSEPPGKPQVTSPLQVQTWSVWEIGTLPSFLSLSFLPLFLPLFLFSFFPPSFPPPFLPSSLFPSFPSSFLSSSFPFSLLPSHLPSFLISCLTSSFPSFLPLCVPAPSIQHASLFPLQ